MQYTALALALLLSLAACGGDESVAAYGAGGHVWTLAEIDGTPFRARATLTFGDEGRISGEAPCNRWSAAQTAPYPWFDAQTIASTRRACPDLPAESEFFAALEAMTQSQVSGDTLLLRNDAGREMVFTAAR